MLRACFFFFLAPEIVHGRLGGVDSFGFCEVEGNFMGFEECFCGFEMERREFVIDGFSREIILR